MAKSGKDNDHTKSGQLRPRGQYRIQYVMMMMILTKTDSSSILVFYQREFCEI